MLMLWWLTGAALFVALAALWTARRTARRLDALTHSYWELRYEFTRLRGAIGGTVIAGEGTDGPVINAPPAQTAPPEASFVSLASLKGSTGKTGEAAQPGGAVKAGKAGE